jgi:hypothetical protein
MADLPQGSVSITILLRTKLVGKALPPLVFMPTFGALRRIDGRNRMKGRPVDEVDGTDCKSRIQYQKPLKAIFLPVTKLIARER